MVVFIKENTLVDSNWDDKNCVNSRYRPNKLWKLYFFSQIYFKHRISQCKAVDYTAQSVSPFTRMHQTIRFYFLPTYTLPADTNVEVFMIEIK